MTLMSYSDYQNFKEIYIIYNFSYFFLFKYVMCEKLHHFMKNKSAAGIA